MHHARALVLACCALASSVACLRTYYPDAGKGGFVETTGGVIVREPEPNLDDLAARFADQICDREVQCHSDRERGDPCVRANLARARLELAAWACSPAATRARVKECLAAIRGEPCTTDLATRRKLCDTNATCPDPGSKLVSPGSVLADGGL